MRFKAVSREPASQLGYGRNMNAEFQSSASRQGRAFEIQARSYTFAQYLSGA